MAGGVTYLTNGNPRAATISGNLNGLRLTDTKNVRIEHADESLLLFNSEVVKIGESYGRTKRKDKEKAP